MKEIILAYQGEMTLKGLNRSKFEARLAKSIRYRLEDLGKFKVTQAQSTVFIEPLEDDLDMDEAFRRISKIFGIVKMSRAACCSKDFTRSAPRRKLILAKRCAASAPLRWKPSARIKRSR